MAKILKNAGNIVKNSWKYLPGLSFVNYLFSESYNQDIKKNNLSASAKMMGHLAYLIAGAAVLSLEIGMREINPITARQVMIKRIEETEQKQRDYQRQISATSEKLFAPYGLADSNLDGKIDIPEKAEAYKRMGLESQVQFPQPKLEELEQAVQDYETR